MPNYQNSKIYKIWNTEDDMIYIGSTTQALCERMAGHRRAVNRHEERGMRILDHMHNIGIEKFHIELVEEFPCENIEQLPAREGHYIRELRPELNKLIAGRTIQEYYVDNRETIQGYN